MRYVFLLLLLGVACKTAPKNRWPGTYEGLLSFDLYCSDITSASTRVLSMTRTLPSW